MIYTLTLNPSIDYVIHVNHLNLGGLNRMDNEMKFPGGKGINVSRILHELEYENTALGFLGGYTGDYVAKQLQNDGINTDFIPIQGETRTNIKLKSDKETEINGHGPDISPAETDKLMRQLGKITRQDTVVLSGSKPASLPGNYYQKLVEQIVTANATFIIDTTGNALRSALAYKPLLVKPNVEELAEMFGVVLNNREDIIYYGEKLLDLGAKHAIVSMAGDGALLFTANGIYYGWSPKGEVKNSVGSGDSMIAGFTGKYMKTNDASEAFRMSLATGSATAFSDDLAKRMDILPLLEKVEISRIDR
ncbi:1-phosphofructokinase [Virgibacillus sp. NKC19-16]|uniref:1-phosphofructokinase n=1 Tax=Virgibacillus salidurans TaxID=2831673 RepID=UPI001F1C00F0|nr:1-phosphofructokinase [Virgibacillus sp. NKC19-16]UJL45884.1 1-phosphofructokinase [Virgibacillus sp. NKC19-16]